jgi:tRNA dimethylallyltransferase
MKPYRAILIAGPTASGKSALAVRMAQRHGGIVVNADSMQVYRDMRILTARPGEAELRAVPHALYGYVGGAEPNSVGRWLSDVDAVLGDCRRSRCVPVITGGTGLYFKALLEGLSPMPPVPAEIRAHWRSEATRQGAARLHEMLAARDPETAGRLRPEDTQRLTRALEVLEATGRSLSDWQREPGRPLIEPEDALRLVVSLDRAELHRRADMRFDAMMAAGALAEVEALASRGYATDAPVMRALGVAPLGAALAGKVSVGAAVERAKLDTRQYIKRQETWLRRNMIAWSEVTTQQMEQFASQNFTFALS